MTIRMLLKMHTLVIVAIKAKSRSCWSTQSDSSPPVPLVMDTFDCHNNRVRSALLVDGNCERVCTDEAAEKSGKRGATENGCAPLSVG